ncbi:MAG TPA: DegV family protein [Vicinamibacteria bacterium]|nr:DegV family protein [Vicinamibacteria bacterium]
MANVAIVTDSSADLTAEQLASAHIHEVPLVVSFGEESFRSGSELTNEDFYRRLTAPGAPFPRTAAPPTSGFEAAYAGALAAGADSIVCVTLSARLSATYSHADSARRAFRDADIRIVDSRTTTHQQGLIVLKAAEAAAGGADADAVTDLLHRLVARSRLYFGLHTLEYLKRGGRISAAQAAVGSVLSVKPIITVEEGVVETVDRPRTASRARARLLELLSARPVEHAVVLHTLAPDVEAFADELAARTGLDRGSVDIGLVGPVAGSHVGPGAMGAAVLYPGG